MRSLLYLSLPLLCALSIAACTSEQQASRTEDRIRESLLELEIQSVNEQFGTRVRCPEADGGDRLRCTAEAADGTSLTVNALQTDDEGRVKLTTKLLETRAVETRLSDRLNDGAPPRPVVLWLECQDLIELRAGGRFTCKGRTLALGGEATNFTLHAKLSDDRGAFTYTSRRAASSGRG